MDNTDERMSQRRLRSVALITLLWALAIAGRLVQLQVVQHAELQRLAESQQHHIYQIPVVRGEIADRAGHLFAVSIPTESVVIDPRVVKDPAFFAGSVARTLGLDVDEVRHKIEELKNRKGAARGFLLLKRHITPDEAEGLKTLPFKAIEIVRDARREYPNGRVASHVVGSVDASGKGNCGVEQRLNADLSGRPGKIRVLTDSLRDPYVTEVSDPGEQAVNVKLTIHSVIQHAAETALREGVDASGARKGSAVVLDPATGEILALANFPDFDPGNPSPTQKEVDDRLNIGVQEPGEPGSVMKMITMTMGLESGRFTPEAPLINCERGSFPRPGRKPIRDVHPHGILDPAHVLINSSNIGAAKIAIALGAPSLYDYLKKFGIGDLTHVELPGETGGILWPLECGAVNSKGKPMPCWSASSHEYIAFGHEVEATAVQLARAVAVIANGGLLVSPHVVLAEERPRSDGTVDRLPIERPPLKRVISADTAIQIRRMMQSVVIEGTGRRASIPGYTAGGKTGSAMLFDKDLKKWVNRHNSSFIGFAPATNPRVVIVVTLNDTPQQGGIAAAPVFSRIGETALRVLQVPKDAPETEVHTAPGLPQREPAADVPAPSVPMRTVSAPEPAAAQPEANPEPQSAGGRLYLTGKRVPDFRGKPVIAVLRESAELGVPVDYVGTGVARNQRPSPGRILPAGERVHIEFARP